jgi:hypothetical protein
MGDRFGNYFLHHSRNHFARAMGSSPEQLLRAFTSCTHNWLHDEKRVRGMMLSVGRSGSTKKFKVLLVLMCLF